MSWFQRLLIITIVSTFVLVVIGGTVRATDSGLGCPDWPTCNGRLIPSADKHTIIEYSHRTAAAVVGVLFLGVTFFTFRDERKNKLVFWLAFSAGVMLAFQIILGGITVKKELPAEIVALHLATAMSFMALLIVTGVISIARGRSVPVVRASMSSPFTRMALLTAAVAFVTLVLGSYISGTDASLACKGWPLCNGSVVPGGSSAEGLHFLHRLVAGLLGLMILGTAWLAFQERRRQFALLAIVVGTGVLYVAQALIGAANIWTDLAAGVVVTHLSLAALLWCAMVLLSALSFYLPGDPALDPDIAPKRPDTSGTEARQWAR
ncbi:MAG: COX15/CtaA family protein [Chloroflexi bacterium]|nr:COX15/CtaA family protein [Chloroflexota bacterium]